MLSINNFNSCASGVIPHEEKRLIACVIPAYNEENFIDRVILSIPDFVDHIIVVNDCSKDRTSEVIRNLKHPRVIQIDHEQNRGVAGAMISGYKKALEIGADIVVKLDGDGQMDPNNILMLVSPILSGAADYTKGVRFRDSDSLREMPLLRVIGNLGLSFLTKIASGYWNIFDPTNGFTAIARKALESIRFDRLGKGYFFETSMLINLYRADAVVFDVPMKARYGNETSKLSPAKVFCTFPYYLARALVKRILWRYFIRDFTAFSAFFCAGLPLFLGGIFFGVYKWIVNSIHGVTTPPGAVMLAALPLLLGFQLLLQAIVLDIHSVPTKPIHSDKNLDGIPRAN